MHSLEYKVQTVGSKESIVILSLDGYVDSATSLSMDEAIDSILKQDIFHIVVDLTQVGYISSAGWGVFISKIKDIRDNGGGLKISGMRPDVKDVFELLGFGHIIEAHENLQDAVMAFEIEGKYSEETLPGAQSKPKV